VRDFDYLRPLANHVGRGEVVRQRGGQASAGAGGGTYGGRPVQTRVNTDYQGGPILFPIDDFYIGYNSRLEFSAFYAHPPGYYGHQRGCKVIWDPNATIETEAGRDVEQETVAVRNRFGRRGPDGLGDPGDHFSVGDFLDQGHELVATESRDHVLLANRGLKPERHHVQHFIPRLVPIRIVDFLESVEVDEDHHAHLPFSLCPIDRS